ncbi:DUF397 domain-containing protein [Actinomadura sp. LOL_016]|uniref:DUF397 domain-containing protein n=1 Tax=unclassified Actinomadura TaxID=2626254 RepID=UPI003A806F68
MIWRKARRSNEHGGACVELAELGDGVGVRDSKDPSGPKLVLDRSAFRALANTLKQG